jgi:hypothetical protein
MSATICGGAQVSRGRADRAYVGMAHSKGVKDNDYRDIRSRRNCSGSGNSSAGDGGRTATVHDVSCGCARQSNDFSGDPRGAATDCGASAAATERGAVCAAARDADEDHRERSAELFGRAGYGPEIAERAARTFHAESDSRNAGRRNSEESYTTTPRWKRFQNLLPLPVTHDKKCRKCVS